MQLRSRLRTQGNYNFKICLFCNYYRICGNKLEEVYSHVFTVPVQPDIYPYFVDVKQIERVNGFRGFDFLITLDAHPTIGPHIPIGEDVFTYRISPFGIELKKFEHLKGPNKNDFPSNYQDLLK
ncbi:DUF3888 domain-containing protein [Paenibacillus sp. FSL R5-0475]|uniref:DUF3888 domain-containing protein n=1 Tax=Paenibacillus sp. FSL R5-0475 TaxID=2921643 RepID=UPI0030FC371E